MPSPNEILETTKRHLDEMFDLYKSLENPNTKEFGDKHRELRNMYESAMNLLRALVIRNKYIGEWLDKGSDI